jgi:leader peptidase (prepilin peptidase) / N-methyltransferase
MFWAERGNAVTLPWIIAAAAVGVIAGPRIRASVFCRSTEPGQPPRRACSACDQEILPGRWRWRSLLPVTGRCPACRARIGPYPLLAELAAGLALAVVAARASSVWELAALAWLVLLTVPLAFIDVAVRRLPDPLTAATFAGTLALLAVAALAGHQPGHLGRAAIGAVALAGFYLVLAVIRPGGLGWVTPSSPPASALPWAGSAGRRCCRAPLPPSSWRACTVASCWPCIGLRAPATCRSGHSSSWARSRPSPCNCCRFSNSRDMFAAAPAYGWRCVLGLRITAGTVGSAGCRGPSAAQSRCDVVTMRWGWAGWC